jgi:innexin
MDVLTVVTRVPLLMFGVERNDDDAADRMNYKYTVAILVIFALIVTNRQFGQKQIHCWVPAYFTRNYEDYINDICWVSNTYFVAHNERLPDNENERKESELKYYQWVPFILLLEAFLFYVPHIIWRAFVRRSGIDMRDLVESASSYKSVDKCDSRAKYMTYMITALDQYVNDPRRTEKYRAKENIFKRSLSTVCLSQGKYLGTYLVILYVFVKIMFISNCLIQLFLLNVLFDQKFHKFGVDVLWRILNGQSWGTYSQIFPKITMCDFKIRELGNPKISHRYSVQCVLPINLFNQQIFTFIWFWYFILLIINIISLLIWLYRFLPSSRLHYIKRRIRIMNQDYKKSNELKDLDSQHREMNIIEKKLLNKFVLEYLELDGAFMLRLLGLNSSDFVCTEVIQELWRNYYKNKRFNVKCDPEQSLSNILSDNDEPEFIDVKRKATDISSNRSLLCFQRLFKRKKSSRLSNNKPKYFKTLSFDPRLFDTNQVEGKTLRRRYESFDLGTVVSKSHQYQETET